MTDDNPSLSALGANAGIIKLGGKTYKLAAPTDRDYGDFERFVQSEYLRLARESAGAFEGADRIDFMQQMIDQARQITFAGNRSKDVMDVMTSVPGCVRLIWLCLRKHHPEMTEEEVGKALTDEQTLEEAFNTLEVMQKKAEEPKPGEQTTTSEKSPSKKSISA